MKKTHPSKVSRSYPNNTPVTKITVDTKTPYRSSHVENILLSLIATEYNNPAYNLILDQILPF